MPFEAPISHHLDLYGYWLSRRGARIMPARGDINPADISPLLPYLMIIESAVDRFRYRLVGTAIGRHVGYDATGVTVGSYLVAPEDAAEARSIFRRVFTGAYPVFATGEFVVKSGAHLNMSLLALPLADDGTVVNMSISTLVTRFPLLLVERRGWLRGLPPKVFNVLDVRDAAELEKFCLDWEQHCSTGDTAAH
jgi:hypothetical protein